MRSVARQLLCLLGLHQRSWPIQYRGMTKGRRNWLGGRAYKSFLDRYRCPSCGHEYEMWT